MKIRIIPDVHGTHHWEDAKNKVNEYDKIIFQGDYVDPYDRYSTEELLSNFESIIEFKKNYPNKVVLLLGNHDLNQYILDEPMSRKNPFILSEMKRLIIDNIDLFQICIQVGDYIVSHAGISKTWMKNVKAKSIDDINKLLNPKDWFAFEFNGYDSYGYDKTQGPTWIRPEALLTDMAFPKQIVGHTRVNNSPQTIKEGNNELILLDSLNQDTIFELNI